MSGRTQGNNIAYSETATISIFWAHNHFTNNTRLQQLFNNRIKLCGFKKANDIRDANQNIREHIISPKTITGTSTPPQTHTHTHTHARAQHTHTHTASFTANLVFSCNAPKSSCWLRVASRALKHTRTHTHANCDKPNQRFGPLSHNLSPAAALADKTMPVCATIHAQHHQMYNNITCATTSHVQHHHICNIITAQPHHICATSSHVQHHHTCKILTYAMSTHVQHHHMRNVKTRVASHI